MRRPLEVITTAEMAEADRATAAAGTSGTVLMDRAGRAVAAAAGRMLGERRGARVLVLCGPGNNGGDGFVAAADLIRRGYKVDVAAQMPIERLGGDAARAAAAWHGPVKAISDVVPTDHDLVVDALFGAGLARPVEGEARAVVARVNAASSRVLAVDLPSGLSGDTGQVMGAAIRADETITFFRLKPGHLLMPGRELCGRVTLADIGIDPAVLGSSAAALSHNLPDLWWRRYPKPSAAGHKYSRGHLLVVSGPMPTLGAARLAARGGLRAGAGLVTLASPEDAVAAHAAHLTSIMLKPFDSSETFAEILSDTRKNAVVMGPGLGHHPETRAIVEAALAPCSGPNGDARPRAVVLDADALTLFAGRADELAALVRTASRPVVITPHDGEFTRLFSAEGEILQATSKVERARAAAGRLGAVVALKGPDTVVASPDGRAAIAGEDTPWLATAGTGDVLAGMVGGHLAQSMPAYEAACAAVWLHAAAAQQVGPGLISEDLPDALPAVLRTLFGREPVR